MIGRLLFWLRRVFVCRGHHLPLGGTRVWSDDGQSFTARCYHCNCAVSWRHDWPRAPGQFIQEKR